MIRCGVIEGEAMNQAPRVDWTKVDHVLLDMDGTLLDLAFDNDFWGYRIHAHYAKLHKLNHREVVDQFEPIFQSVAGTLSWYSTDFWSQQYGFDIIELSQQYREGIRWLPLAQDFLLALRTADIRATILTNAHPDIVTLKHSVLGIKDYVDQTLSSHDIGYPKEHPAFWEAIPEITGISEAQLKGDSVWFFDDSPAVLTAAINAGLHNSVMMCAPDSTLAPKMSTTPHAIHTFNDIWPLSRRNEGN